MFDKKHNTSIPGGMPTVGVGAKKLWPPPRATFLVALLLMAGWFGRELIVQPEPGVPRMPLALLKQLYDDPVTRPVVLDVRATDHYAAGHVAGASNIPEADLDRRAGELPKDRLIVAYCQ